MSKANRYSPEVRERAVRMVFEHEREYSSQWSAMCSIAKKIGCTPETLNEFFYRFNRRFWEAEITNRIVRLCLRHTAIISRGTVSQLVQSHFLL